ncbi:hypothetical protein C817_05469 [Dorea sp. 5-2]|nr:hypothetical protein C817_05469 [Dorea sp. 5-2]
MRCKDRAGAIPPSLHRVFAPAGDAPERRFRTGIAGAGRQPVENAGNMPENSLDKSHQLLKYAKTICYHYQKYTR